MPPQVFSLTMNTSTRQHLLGYDGKRLSPNRTIADHATFSGLRTHSSRNGRDSGDSNPVETERPGAVLSFSSTPEVVCRHLML